MKRRLISGNLYNTVPKLVKLVSPLGIQQNYIIEKKYKFVDLLIVGGGGGGGTNSGGGGASGTIAFARNIKISLLPKTLTCKIAKPVNAQTDGDSTTLEINGDTIICAGGQRGNSEGAGGLGNGSKIPDSIYTILSKLVENPSSDIAICNNGGGSPGYWNGSYGYAGGSGASMSGNGNSSSGMTGGNSEVMQMVWAVIKVEIVNLIKVVQDINITMYLFLLAYLEEVELRGKARTDLVRMDLEQVVGRQVLNQVEIQGQAILRMAEMVALELVAEEVVVCHVKEEKEDRV